VVVTVAVALLTVAALDEAIAEVVTLAVAATIAIADCSRNCSHI
jgi:hypothetical protein